MSAQFGRWNFDGKPPAPEYLDRVKSVLSLYGPDGSDTYADGNLMMLYCAFHTTKEAGREAQPTVTPLGSVMTWDGRLDNRAELIAQLGHGLTTGSTDIAIVADAYDRWGSKCFAKLVGDWAMSVWRPADRSLTLAIDPVGTRHLYYSLERSQINWCTVLDPLVLFAEKSFSICEDYIAGWFSYFPAADLTPYIGIYAVPPSSAVVVRPGTRKVCKYWEFDPGKRIRYGSDAEYEDHFRTVFGEAIRRRLRSEGPILADLSGGMDSSSVVCMADNLMAGGASEASRLDTISWTVRSEPSILEDSSYYAVVEKKRGRTGFHVALDMREAFGSSSLLIPRFEHTRFAATPICCDQSMYFKLSATYVRSQGHRVRLTGIAGESATGGYVPTPRPELQNLLARGHWLTLVRQVNAWAIKMRKPISSLLWDAVRGFVKPSPAVGVSTEAVRTPWFSPGFVSRTRFALSGYQSRVKLFGALPSFQEHMRELDGERKLMAFYRLFPDLLLELRYPFLDRDLREFMYAIPQDQIVRVGQRRSLMKRSLAGIVPDEILNRRRKLVRQKETHPATRLLELPDLDKVRRSSKGCALGILDSERLAQTLKETGNTDGVPVEILTKTLTLESWLSHLTTFGILKD